MGSKPWVLLACLAACGQVEKASHDAAIDSARAIDAAPDAFTCPAMETVCATSCCTMSEGCSNNTCIDATASCVNIKLLNPNAPSGPYIHSADNAQFFCDMSQTTPVQYEGLALAPFNGSFPGYSIIDAAQLQNPVIQQAFIWAFNKQGGMTALQSYLPPNVCATVSAGQRLLFGGSLMFPSQGQTQTSNLMAGMQYGQELISSSTFIVAPLPPNFFTTYPASQGTGCSDGNNPGFWFQKH